ncbi:non-canonical purine NTP pyrophosphatase, RdgB/HAM1 family [Pseudoclavibacter sp. RFBJ3]|uniref:RdgB/HAM1 family non-canonical purine NTP pyrophosphatase n=1 Tax=unclassified Pseudoclavibacter TaxID=2615177 RepID=UPI000CE88ACB|nr:MULTISPECIES: RdgB/HAM1 family non-canonical purine NTP pyrophosphatase [unclassified Pseudoclavibacter]PPF84769.1 non-canonical purine NTP pyrophosphatase, RdgB/HAM1 family [Pseudoclavibacter sp. RFBJ5]PPF93772.1 non-canonical purine NTP pyrophosphatase, RdgB/HAM1 family [Pseudoclavibacter sp. RFBJ3]PPF98489.1 non-canonical purine NTP pyrophosphatase, RdgB/HAM1 family [Pseudoclavibacter sp. RFBH5]PPG03032.1 non-canonical purine NTP pyrophosphatase, RdgB/HAM1 family [Pseudoclavibacter sp. RF
MSEPVRVVLASHNAHKLIELRRILGAQLDGIELVAYDGPEPRETGLSFESNALLKARAAAEHTGLPALADDSGISVDVLGGSPGIFSARWSGPAKDAKENLELLLWQLSDVSHPNRAAQFVAAAALVVPASASATGEELSEAVLGVWPGRILEQRSGDHGFGYDPIFQPDGAEGSAADLTDAEKDASSHRRRAFDALAPKLRAALGL